MEIRNSACIVAAASCCIESRRCGARSRSLLTSRTNKRVRLDSLRRNTPVERHDVWRGSWLANGPYIRRRRAVNCPPLVRGSTFANRIAAQTELQAASLTRNAGYNLKFFLLYDPLAIYRDTRRSGISSQPLFLLLLRFFVFFFLFFCIWFGKKKFVKRKVQIFGRKRSKRCWIFDRRLAIWQEVDKSVTISSFRAISDGNCCGYKVYLYVSSSYNEAFFFFFFRNYSFHGIQFV